MFSKNELKVAYGLIIYFLFVGVLCYAAFPQIFWLIVNDAHYGPEYPNNNAFAREVGYSGIGIWWT